MLRARHADVHASAIIEVHMVHESSEPPTSEAHKVPSWAGRALRPGIAASPPRTHDARPHADPALLTLCYATAQNQG